MRFLKGKGFKVEVLKQYISKTILKVEKDGLVYSIELMDGIVDIKRYMNLILFSHKQKVEIEELRKELRNRSVL